MYVHIHINFNLRFPTCLHAHSIPSLPQALASLAEAAHEATGSDDDPQTYVLSPHFGDVIKSLVETADRLALWSIIIVCIVGSHLSKLYGPRCIQITGKGP